MLKYNVPFYFGGTSLLIIVVVTMDFWAQVQSLRDVPAVRIAAEEGEFQGRLTASRTR